MPKTNFVLRLIPFFQHHKITDAETGRRQRLPPLRLDQDILNKQELTRLIIYSAVNVVFDADDNSSYNRCTREIYTPYSNQTDNI